MLRNVGVIAAAVLIAGCSGSDGSVEAEADSGDDVAAETAVDDSAALDSEPADTAVDSTIDDTESDSGAPDSSGGDSSSMDSSSSEVESDSASSDSAPTDSGSVDSTIIDSALTDSAVVDSAVADSAVVDSAVVDSAIVDSAVETSVDSGIDTGVDASCGTGTHPCSGHCAMDDSVTECGAACVSCTAPAHATSICSSGACDFACTSPYVKSGAACVPPTTRPIAPLSTETVTTHLPKLTWKLPAGFTQAHVDVCADRACATIRWSKDVTGSSVTVDTALPAGVSYWRVFTLEGTTKSASSPVWELVTMGAGHDGAVSTSWTSFHDFDGDGFADIVADTNDFGGTVRLHRGTATGLAATFSGEWHASGSSGTVGQSANLGDIDGDGFGDMGLMVTGGADGLPDVEYALGGPTGPSATATRLAHMPGLEQFPVAAGDVNGDGYGDVLTRGINGTARVVYVRFGSATGIPATASITIPAPPAAGGTFGVRANGGVGCSTIGDFDADGFADIAIGSFEDDHDSTTGANYGAVYIYRGSATGPSTTPSQTILNPNKAALTGTTNFGSSLSPAGDVNGDGYPDLFVASSGGSTGNPLSGHQSFILYGSSAGTLGTPTTLTCLAPTGGTASEWSNSGADLNGDGFADATCSYITSIPDPPSGATAHNEYGSHLYLGGAGGASTTSKSLIAYDPATMPGRVYSAHIPGDVDGDGIADYVTLTEWRDAGGTNHRSVETWKGTSPTLTTASTRIFAYETGEILANVIVPHAVIFVPFFRPF